MANVLILSSSPRKGGNSDVLCDAFAKGAFAAGYAVRKVRIAEKKIGYCQGCYACRKLNHCIQQDDAAELLEAMKAADVIVFASPVYFYSVSAQLKTVFDRTVAIFPTLTNKAYYFLMTMADDEAANAAGTIQAMQGFLDCYDGSTLRGTLVAPGVYERGDVVKTPYVEQAYQLGRTV